MYNLPLLMPPEWIFDESVAFSPLFITLPKEEISKFFVSAGAQVSACLWLLCHFGFEDSSYSRKELYWQETRPDDMLPVYCGPVLWRSFYKRLLGYMVVKINTPDELQRCSIVLSRNVVHNGLNKQNYVRSLVETSWPPYDSRQP